jgi:putative nucleotidyltransferase with HDIG domain
MKTFRDNLLKYSKFIFWGFAFITAAVLLYLILPSEPRFMYEYQKGAPWKHDNLVAPFDFAILKSSNEIEIEKREATKNFAPYFLADTVISTQKLGELIKDLGEIKREEHPEISAVERELVSSLQAIYYNGILLTSPEAMDVLANKSEISVVTGNMVDRRAIADLTSEKTAYNNFRQITTEVSARFPEVAGILRNLDAAKYIKSNLSYDDNYTRSELNRLESSIATARGMVQAGERIILKGEIVDDSRFQLLESLKGAYEMKRGEGINSHLISVGKFLLILVFLGLLFTYLYIYKPNILSDTRKLSFLLLFLVFVVFLAQAVNSYENLHIYIVPLAILPVVIRTFYDPRTAIFTLIITSILIGFYAPNNYEFVLLEVSAGMVAVFSLNKMHRRVHVVIASLLVLFTYALVFTAVTMIREGTLIAFNFRMLQWFAWSSLLILVVYPLIFIFEKMFGFVSDVTLIELSNTNQPLLRKLAEEAPGTFQHSMQIANLAEEVILKIGGNPYLVRAGALYHDIGKAVKPTYFIENQEMGMNPHDMMSYKKSAEIIIDHVRHGIKTAQKHKLPASIIEFIATHHGTTKAKYFYLKHLQDNPNEQLNEDDFVYPGPLPRSREAAVVMLVDGIEAASRSMKEKTLAGLRTLINDMIDQKVKDNQLDNSDLTFSDISKIKEILLKKLVNIYHVRIEYPSEK